MEPEIEVKNKYPDAICRQDGVLFFVSSNKKDLGAGFSKVSAWYSAYEFINRSLVQIEPDSDKQQDIVDLMRDKD